MNPMAITAGTDVEQLLRCLLTLNTQHQERMPYPVVPYVVDFEPIPGVPAGGQVSPRLHADAHKLTDVYALANHCESVPAPEPAELPYFSDPSLAAYAFVPHQRIGAALVLEIDDPALPQLQDLPEYAEQSVRQLQALDLTGTLVSVVHLEGGHPRWWIKPAGEDGYGDQAAAVDIATTRPDLERLAWEHITGHTKN